MALTRVQLLSGNQSQGTVLPGQVQGVSQGIGVVIDASGQISVDATTTVGIVKLNSLTAYNAYVWPSVDGTANQFLQTDGAGNLSWAGAAGFGVVTVSASAPASPDIGELWFDCSTAELNVYQNCVGTPSPNWFKVSQPGLPVLPVNVSATPAFGSGTGVIADPFLLAAGVAPAGTSIFLPNTITVTGLAPFQYVPLVDLNAGTNLNRFHFSNYYTDASGTLTFQIIFRDLPNSAPGASYVADIRVGYASAYLRANVSVTTPLSLSGGLISGTPTAGSPVSYTPGTASGGIAPYAYTYQWYADGALISGATSTSYTPPAGDVGKVLSVTQRVSDSLNYVVSSTTTASAATVAGAIPGWNPTGSINIIPGDLSGNYTGPGTAITATGCIEVSINGGAYGAGGPISSGQTLAIRWKTDVSCGGAASGTTITGSVTDGTGTNSYSITVSRIPSPAIADIASTDVALGATVSKGTATTIQGINTTAYVTYVGTSTGTNIEAATLPGGPFTPLATSGTGFPITDGQTLYIQQTAGATINASPGYTAVIRVGDGTNAVDTYDEFTYFARTVSTSAFPNSSFTPPGGPNASPASVSIAGESLYGTASCANWADGSTNLTSTGGLQFRVGAGAYGTGSTAVADGNTVDLIWDPAAIAAAADGVTLNGTLTNGIYTNEYSITIDRAVSGFTFPDLTGQALSTAVTSAVETPNGYNVPVSLTFAGTGTNPLTSLGVSVAGGAFGASPQTVNPGQTVQVQGTTGAAVSTSYGVNLSMGSGPVAADTWTAATASAAPAIVTPSITSPANGATNLNPALNTPAGISLVGDTYTPLNGAGAQDSSTWEVYRALLIDAATSVITAVNTVAGQNGTAWTQSSTSLGGANAFVSGFFKGTWIVGDVNGGVSTTTNRTTWTTRSAGSSRWNGFAAGPNLAVLVGGSGALRTSTDAITWTSRTSSFGTTNINGAGYSHSLGMFCAVGDAGDIATSPDGITWTQRTSGTTTNLNSVVYGNGQWVAVGQSGVTRTSPDGITWTSRTNATTNNLFRIGYGNGVFIASGQGGAVVRSTDGITWSLRTSVPSTALVQGVAYNSGIWMLVGDNGRLSTSTNDGLTWTSQTAQSGIFGSTDIRSASYGGGYFLLSGTNNSNTAFSSGTTVTLTLSDSTDLTSMFPGDRIQEFGTSTDAAGSINTINTGTNQMSVSTDVGTWTVGANVRDTWRKVVAPVPTLDPPGPNYVAVTGSPFTVSVAPFTTVSVPQASLAVSSTYYARVQYATTNALAATSLYSAWSSFGTAASFAITPGTAYGGGYFAGQINDGGTIYNLIVAPVTSGALRGQQGGAAATIIQYKTTNTADAPAATVQNVVYGGPTTDLFKASAAHPVFNTFINGATGPNAGAFNLATGGAGGGTGIGGFNDWYLPAVNELEIVYRNLKPTTTSNSTGSGANANAVPSATSNYTAGNPSQTTSTLFVSGGTQAYATADYYWSSTQNPGNTAQGGGQQFTDGTQQYSNKGGSSRYARAVRRVLA